MKFPIKEADVILLAERMSAGLTEQATFFPSPPVAVEELRTALNNFALAIHKASNAKAIYDKAMESKKADYDKLIDIMKKELRYAENTASGDEAMLEAIGWGAKKTATPITAPEACYKLKADKEGQGWVSLSWQRADKGGKPSAYTIERRTKEGDWAEVGSTTERKKDLVDQPMGIPLYYRVIGFNKAGQSAASNTLEVTL